MSHLVSRRSLHWHTPELPWHLRVLKQNATIAHKLPAVPGSLANKLWMARPSHLRINEPFIGEGEGWLKARSVPGRTAGMSANATRKAKCALRASFTKAKCELLTKLTEHNSRIGRSVALMIRTLHLNPRDHAKYWQEKIPSMDDRAALHKLKLGAVKNTKLAHSRAVASKRIWRDLPLQQRREAELCFCRQGPQTPYHLFGHCQIAKPFQDYLRV